MKIKVIPQVTEVQSSERLAEKWVLTSTYVSYNHNISKKKIYKLQTLPIVWNPNNFKTPQHCVQDAMLVILSDIAQFLPNASNVTSTPKISNWKRIKTTNF